MITSWDDMNLGTYIEFYGTLKDDELEEDDVINLTLSILLDKGLDDIEDMDYDDYLIHLENIKFLNTPMGETYDEEITIDGITFRVLDFDRIEFGAFIDLEHMLVGTEYIDNLAKVFSIFYRQVDKEGTTLNKAVCEPYGDWLDIRGTLFDKVSITSLYGLLTKYLSYRGKIFSIYEGLFQEKDEEMSEEELIEELKDMTQKERDAFTQEENVNKWGWILMLLKLANNDPLKVSEAAKLPILEALNLLSMMRELKMG